MNEVTRHTLDVIKQRNIMPSPRWRFLLRNYVMWTAAGLTLFIGSLSVPVIIHTLTTSDWDVYAYIDGSWPRLVLVSLPYFWLVLLTLVIALAGYHIRHTKSGYRYNGLYIIAASVGISLLAGSLLYMTGLGAAIDEQMAQSVPLYNHFARPRHRLWLKHGDGLLAGTVITVTDDTRFQLQDFRNQEWEVFYFMPNHRRVWLEPGLRIRALGREVDDDTFNAHVISAFDRRGGWIPAQAMPSALPGFNNNP